MPPLAAVDALDRFAHDNDGEGVIDPAAMTEIVRILRDTIANPVGPEFMALSG
jgi:hypothetical protein